MVEFTFMASEREGTASVVPNSAPAGRRRGRSRQVPRVGTRHRFSYPCRRTAQLLASLIYIPPLVSRRTVKRRHRVVVQAQVDAQLRAVMNTVVHNRAPQNGDAGGA